MRALLRAASLLLALLFLLSDSTAQPTYCNYNTCTACRADDPGDANGAMSGRCTGTTCWAYVDGNQCPETCAAKTNCADCTSTQGCGWCGATKTCSVAGGNGPCNGNCVTNDDASCWKVSNVSSCPRVSNCATINDCAQCTTAGCAWCPGTSTCFEATADGTSVCPAQPIPSCYGLDCIRDSPQQCPRANCTSLTNCKDCASAGCDWCGLTSLCMEGSSDPSVNAPCGARAWCGNAGMTECYKSDPQQCPTAPSCEALLDCKSCTTSGCFWCGKSRICMEASNSSSPRPCKQGSTYTCGGFTLGDCWKGDPDECPAADCDNFSDCASCTNAKCYWCGKTAKCLEASAEADPRPCMTGAYLGCQTDQEQQCWKGSPSQCPTKRCDSISDCKTCARAGCTWCGANGKCMETTDTDTPAPCGYNWDSCGSLSPSDCWKSAPNTCPQDNCNAINNCTDCTDAGCSWCADTQKCRETTVGTTPQALCTPTDGCLSAGCWKKADDMCPHYANGTEFFCDLYDGNCQQCVANGCGYCSSSKKCLEVSSNGRSQCEGSTQSSSLCPPASWNVGTCDVDCGQRPSTCACLSTPGCGLCAGTSTVVDGKSILVTKCVAIDSKAKPASGTTCLNLYTNPATCPNCYKTTSGDCTTCLSNHACGWCPGYCVYGDSEMSYQQNLCPSNGEYRGDIDDANGCKVCPTVNGEECNAPYGTCNRTTATCQCLGSRTGAKCDVVCNPGCGYGVCAMVNNQPQCICDQGWTSLPGKPCSVYCSGASCSGHGTCNNDGTCTCDEDYYGVDCSKYCSPTQSCSGHGTCDKNGQCVCDPGNYGSQCTCNAQNCLNGGTCHASGVCNCAPTYFGPTCAVHCDASVSCHSHGNCSVSGCTCFVGWTGSDCSQRQCWAADDCADCASNSACGWCEEANSCLQRNTTKSNCNFMVQCSDSVSMLSYAACTDGEHCNCYACETLDGWRSLLADSHGKPVAYVGLLDGNCNRISFDTKLCRQSKYVCAAKTTTPPITQPPLDEASIFLIGLLFLAVIIGSIAGFFLWRRYKEMRPGGVRMDEMESELKLLGDEIAHEEVITPPNVAGPVMKAEDEADVKEIEIKPTPTKIDDDS